MTQERNNTKVGNEEEEKKAKSTPKNRKEYF